MVRAEVFHGIACCVTHFSVRNNGRQSTVKSPPLFLSYKSATQQTMNRITTDGYIIIICITTLLQNEYELQRVLLPFVKMLRIVWRKR